MNHTGRFLPHMHGAVRQVLLILAFMLLAVGCAGQGVYHQVAPGQTLYRISKTYAVDEAYLARINGIADPSQLRVGTRIYIPGAFNTKYVPATVQPTSARPKPVTPPVARALKTPSSERSKAAPTPPPAPPAPGKKEENPPKYSINALSTPKTNSQQTLKLHWPLRGKILLAFGDAGQGGGKGLEIAARDGSPVSAAAAGKVIYSGDGVQGYGHLMILQHENDTFTVYGFNRKNYVKQGQFVSQGEKIASSGRPPSGGSGRLHFEVRIGKKAVDPILYLP
jgi:lipoprotein NlpD